MLYGCPVLDTILGNYCVYTIYQKKKPAVFTSKDNFASLLGSGLLCSDVVFIIRFLLFQSINAIWSLGSAS
jgi:hypothetical protein